ncbi:cell division protein FtsL [Gracilibacillus caseinilyticus]|uniref:Cell division protein FtsL n=1 Tax=Gracilibacillus caseinilyticus TaxID=2932256 RepID=A0ABY4EU78_9BACI|nr:cell division protein FtsL [Gracilibacillus caseinilyticus]UOQ47965.1 cell division protein FtsL [Gracilibacillus caseinilyticus]
MSSQHARVFHSQEQVQHPVQQPNVVRKKVKVQKRWVTRGEKFMYILFAAITLSFSTYIVTYSSSLDQLNRNIDTLNTQIEEQSVHNANLTYKVKELSQPERIIANAKEHGLKVQNTQVKQASEVTD